MRPRRAALTWCIIAPILAGALGCRRGETARGGEEETRPSAAPVSVETELVRRGAIDEVVVAHGTLASRPGTSVRLAPLMAGRIASVSVREGDRVVAGQVLATMDCRSLHALTAGASAALRGTQKQAKSAALVAAGSEQERTSAVRLATIGLEAARLDRDAAVQQARGALESAEVEARKTHLGPRAQEVAQADQTVLQAIATHDRARTERERQAFLFEKGIAPRRQLEDATTALAVATASVESARLQASLLHSGSRAEDIRASDLRVSQAREALDAVRRAGETKIALADAALTQARQSVSYVRAKLEDARASADGVLQKRAELVTAQLTEESSAIRAPLSGVVTRRLLAPGDAADPSSPVLEMSDPNALELLASLPVEQGARIGVGAPASVTLSGADGVRSRAQVLSIGQVDSQSNLLSVRLSVERSTGAFRSGAFATAEIVVSRHPAALLVGRRSVVTREAGAVLFVVTTDGLAHERPVRLGAERGGTVEVMSGVQAGDRVVVVGQYELSDGTKVVIPVRDEGGGNRGPAKSDVR